MSKYVEFEFCELPETPREFDIEKFKAGEILDWQNRMDKCGLKIKKTD